MTDQPMPTPGREDVWERLFARDPNAMLRQRAAKGMETYGRSLETFNGRNALQDARVEALDLLPYIEQAEAERAVLVGLLREAYERHRTRFWDDWTQDWLRKAEEILGPNPEAWS